jgi:hypothetical protein
MSEEKKDCVDDVDERTCYPCEKVLATKSNLIKHTSCKTHKAKIKNCKFGIDGAKTIVKPSILLSSLSSDGDRNTKEVPMGLFAGETINKGTIVTWYLGMNFSMEEIEKRMDNNDGKDSSYVIDVGSNEGVDYHIDGWLLKDEVYSTNRNIDKKFFNNGQPILKGVKSLATYINHKKDVPNVEFRYIKTKDAFKQSAVAIIAIKNIKKDEELFVNYGDGYHQSLIDGGLLVV